MDNCVDSCFRHMASQTEQKAKGHLERQKITDESEGNVNGLFILV